MDKNLFYRENISAVDTTGSLRLLILTIHSEARDTTSGNRTVTWCPYSGFESQESVLDTSRLTHASMQALNYSRCLIRDHHLGANNGIESARCCSDRWRVKSATIPLETIEQAAESLQSGKQAVKSRKGIQKDASCIIGDTPLVSASSQEDQHFLAKQCICATQGALSNPNKALQLAMRCCVPCHQPSAFHKVPQVVQHLKIFSSAELMPPRLALHPAAPQWDLCGLTVQLNEIT